MEDNILKLVIFSDIHYLDEGHNEQYNRKLTKLAIPLFEKLNDEINNHKGRIYVSIWVTLLKIQIIMIRI